MSEEQRERCFTRKRMRLEDLSYSEPSLLYFATLCARDKENVFANQELANVVVESLLWRRDSGELRIFCYCLMPTHLHVALSPTGPGISVSDSIGGFKRYTTSQSWKLGFDGQLWQRSWYDHIARRDEDLLAICRYIIENPVRKQLVDTAEEWPYCGMLDPLPI